MREHYLSIWRNEKKFNASLNYYKAMSFPPKSLFTTLPVHLNPLFKSYNVSVPTLVLWGEKDVYLEKSVNSGLNKIVKDLEIIYYPGNSHWIVHEIPERISAQIKRFSKNKRFQF